MGHSFETPQPSGGHESSSADESKITAKWYFDTSHEGRTGAEFRAMREELRKATMLDFIKMRSDLDYRCLMHENPYLEEFTKDVTVFNLVRVYEARRDIGLSEEQLLKLLAVFDQDV